MLFICIASTQTKKKFIEKVFQKIYKLKHVISISIFMTENFNQLKNYTKIVNAESGIGI